MFTQLSRPVINKPLVNEKTMGLIKNNMYTFIVDLQSTKEEITKAVEEMFKVSVVSVKTVRSNSLKKVQRSRKGYFNTRPVKKAIVQVKKGDKIAIFESSVADEVKVETVEGEQVTTIREKKSLLKGTKVKVERDNTKKEKSK